MKRALIVDAEEDVRSEIAACLGALGWGSLSVSPDGAREALREAASADLALVFIPADCPDLAALADLARISAPGRLVIAMAELDRKTELRDAVESGLADDLLPLPFSPGDMRGICKMVRDDGL